MNFFLECDDSETVANIIISDRYAGFGLFLLHKMESVESEFRLNF